MHFRGSVAVLITTKYNVVVTNNIRSCCIHMRNVYFSVIVAMLSGREIFGLSSKIIRVRNMCGGVNRLALQSDIDVHLNLLRSAVAGDRIHQSV